jgi:Rha family phage regulatory protein
MKGDAMQDLTTLPDPLLMVRDAQAVADSRIVASMFNKLHKMVMRSIRNLVHTDPSCGCNFALTFDEVPGPKGGVRKTPFYFMTEEGFWLLVMGFTGEQAIAVKRRFIHAFQNMRAFIEGNREAFMERMRDWELRERESLACASKGSHAMHTRRREKPALEHEHHDILAAVQLTLKLGSIE